MSRPKIYVVEEPRIDDGVELAIVWAIVAITAVVFAVLGVLWIVETGFTLPYYVDPNLPLPPM